LGCTLTRHGLSIKPIITAVYASVPAFIVVSLRRECGARGLDQLTSHIRCKARAMAVYLNQNKSNITFLM
jgi:hypothetical protein